MAYAGEYDDLEKYGFRLVKNNKEKLHIIFLNDKNKNIVISKKRFKNSEDALQFCNQQNLSFKNSGYVMFLLAMSGVAYNHDFIKKAIVFDFSKFLDSKRSLEKEKKTGVWSWLGTEIDTITLMYDGEGMNGHEISLAEINSTLNTEITLPALCSDASLWDPLN
jgi:hypothetical protein